MSFQPSSIRFKEFGATGAPLAAGRLYTYASGTTTHKAAYTDATLGTPQSYTTDGSGNKYITLDSRGEARVWLGSGAYTFVVTDSDGANSRTVDGVQDPKGEVDTLRADLLNTTDPTKGAGMIMVKRAAAAVARTVLDVLISDISLTPEDFGAVGDDSTDDTIAVNLAIAALGSGGGTIKFDPSKVYRVSSISLAGKDYVTLEGDGGKTQSTIRWTGATGDVVDLSGSRFITWRRLNFLPLVEKTSGSLFRIPAGATDHYFEHVRISSALLGWDIDGDNVFFKHVEALDYNNTWQWQNVMRVGNVNQAAFIELDDVIAHHSSVFTGAAFHIIDVDTFIGRAVFVQKSNAGQLQGFQIDGGEFIQLHQTHIEPGTTVDGIVIAGGANINLVDCHVTTAKRGVRITGGKAVEVVCGRYYYNAEEGIRIEGGSGALVDGAAVNDNSTTTPGAKDGIYVAADVSDFRIVNNGMGSVRGSPVNCRCNIYVADGASDRYVISSNVCTDNTTGALYDGGTGAKKSVKDNTGSNEDKPMSHATLTTTDATVTTLWSHTLADECTYYVKATIMGQSSDTSQRFAYERTCLAYRDGGGVATIQGQATPVTIESTGTMDATFDTSANDLRLRVTGIAGTTLRWRAHVEVTKSTQLV